MKVSFDFDGTLDKKHIQKYAKQLVDKGYEVWIVTARYDSIDKYNDDFMQQYGLSNLEEDFQNLFNVAEKVGINKDNIHFCNMSPKIDFIKNKSFTWHLDDDSVEIYEINNDKDDCVCIDVYDMDYKKQCNKLINK